MILWVLAPFLLTVAPIAQKPDMAPHEQVAALKAGLGPCSADFTVHDVDGNPIYGATVHVRVRYGAFGVKRSDLEVGTNADGKARIEGLPRKAKPLMYDVRRGERKAVLVQDVAAHCSAQYSVTLK